jgi:hypothetical protein
MTNFVSDNLSEMVTRVRHDLSRNFCVFSIFFSVFFWKWSSKITFALRGYSTVSGFFNRGSD